MEFFETKNLLRLIKMCLEERKHHEELRKYNYENHVSIKLIKF